MGIWEQLVEATSSEKWAQNRKRWDAHKQGRPEGRFNSEMSPFHGKLEQPIQKAMDDLAAALDKDRGNLQKPVLDAFVQLAQSLKDAREKAFRQKMGYDKQNAPPEVK